LTFYLQTAGFSAVTLRLFDVYGPGDTRPKLFNLLRRASQSSTPLAMSPGAQLLDLVYVDDVVDAYVMAAQLIEAATPGVHAIYGVSSGSPISLREVVDIYGEVIHTKIPIQWGLRPYRDREVMIPWRQSIPVPGWAPRVSLRDGIRRMEGCG
jgi:nucleoside-diphosphate-sugar epimerase